MPAMVLPFADFTFVNLDCLARSSDFFPSFVASSLASHASLQKLSQSTAVLALIFSCRRSNFPFRKQAMPFSRHLEIFLTINNFFSAKLEKKGNYVYNHPASNSEPLLLNIPLIPLHYQVDPPIFRKVLLESVTFLRWPNTVFKSLCLILHNF